ncbi:hypothetical protein ANPL_02010 [Anaplasma platys]|uniref:Smr domain-containing protein n=1 Tax=Anaplasma platys TaxID=949 RepID=A0A858PYL6_9RICK|nr:Smr/MutS family protein [Anaplasma platys]QJC27664.1 hypothetical protein ANPL_02010 [Anaplasma platys]
MKAGNGGEKSTNNSDSCWEDIKKSVSPIKQRGKVVCCSVPTEPFSTVEFAKKSRRSVHAPLDPSRNHKTTSAHLQYGSSHEKLTKPQFLCSEERGILSGIDWGTKTRIDRGKYKIDATIDLHGYGTNVAYDLLVDFVIDSYERSRKCILVITGWGSKSAGENALRSNLHHWLQSDQIVNLILYYKQATPAHGGKGAFYVLLRKNKQKRISPNGYKEDL